VPSKRGAGKEETMKASMLMKTVAALAIGAAFPLGAIAAQPTKMMTERGVIQKVNAASKEFALKGGHLRRTAIFEWNASTRFVENGKPAAASELKTGERATVNYARHGKQRVATRIAISPSGKTAQGGVIEKVNAPRKEFAHNWLDS
jgi:Cu/Ag efflux protein CusF